MLLVADLKLRRRSSISIYYSVELSGKVRVCIVSYRRVYHHWVCTRLVKEPRTICFEDDLVCLSLLREERPFPVARLLLKVAPLYAIHWHNIYRHIIRAHTVRVYHKRPFKIKQVITSTVGKVPHTVFTLLYLHAFGELCIKYKADIPTSIVSWCYFKDNLFFYSFAFVYPVVDVRIIKCASIYKARFFVALSRDHSLKRRS